MALAHLGDAAVVQRNVHSSVIDGLVLSGLRPTFVAPEIDDELGVAHCLTPDALGDGARRRSRCGRRLRGLPDLLRRRRRRRRPGRGRSRPRRAARRRRVVGSAPRLLRRAARQRARVRRRRRPQLGPQARRQPDPVGDPPPRHATGIDGRIVDRSVTLVESTSPSALLTASLDAARRQNVVAGQELLARDDRVAGGPARARSCAIPGLDVLDEEIAEAPSVFAWDPLRLSIDVRGTGATGNEIAKYMRERARHLVRALRRERRRRRLRDRRGRRARPARGCSTASATRPPSCTRESARSARAVRAAAAVGAARDDAARGLPRPAGDRSASTTPRGGSPPSRWRPTRPASRTCCPASASAARRSTSSPTRSPTAARSAARATGRLGRSGW